jgi:two-component system OmpR family response regulator/two-component system response regulator QseB
METTEFTTEFRAEAGSRVLVVEDDVPLAQLLRQQLESRSYAVSVVHDGEAAKNTIHDGRFDLVILDLNLPKLDGVSLLQQMRPAQPRLPVLVLTARNRVEDRALSLDTGADYCMIKRLNGRSRHNHRRALLRPGSNFARSRSEIILACKRAAKLEVTVVNSPLPSQSCPTRSVV